MKTLEPFSRRRGSHFFSKGRQGFYLSIDPGACTGWAVWFTETGRPRLVAAGIGEPPFEQVDACLAEAVIECPQVYPRSPVPPNDLITLAVLVGRYAEACVQAADRDHDRVRLVLPHAWKGSVPKEVTAKRVLAALSPDELAVLEEAYEDIPKGLRHNLLDAVGIGLHAYRAHGK